MGFCKDIMICGAWIAKVESNGFNCSGMRARVERGEGDAVACRTLYHGESAMAWMDPHPAMVAAGGAGRMGFVRR